MQFDGLHQCAGEKLVDPRKHYMRIGELSLGPDFDGLLPWGHIDNRPFLRCMRGFGLCLWWLERFEEAQRVFERMLWLNPPNNQGVRFLIDDVGARTPWEDREAQRAHPRARKRRNGQNRLSGRS